jgi:prepilin-type N-terminal cleavage/methylation domain-containing protein
MFYYKNMPARFKGFTMVELLMVVSIVAILSTIILFANIKSAMEKARDSTRKQDLNKLARIFEDYQNDHQRYPSNDPATGILLNTPWGTPLADYPIDLPKDPLSPSQNYYYETEPDIQSYFAIYARLENRSDTDIITSGCEGGCGPNRFYNYVVHSTNVVMLAGIPNLNQYGYPGIAGYPTRIPTLQLTPPPVLAGACAHHDCCISRWCGADSYPGVRCAYPAICLWVPTDKQWQCADPEVVHIPCP